MPINFRIGEANLVAALGGVVDVDDLMTGAEGMVSKVDADQVEIIMREESVSAVGLPPNLKREVRATPLNTVGGLTAAA